MSDDVRFYDETVDLGDDKRVEVKAFESEPHDDSVDIGDVETKTDPDRVLLTVEGPDGSLKEDNATMLRDSEGNYYFVFETERGSDDYPEGIYKFTVSAEKQQVDEYEIRKVRYRE